MEYITSALLWGGIGIVVGFIWLFYKNYRKALKDPDVRLASKLGMSMPIFRDCQEVYKEWYAPFYGKEKANYSRQPKNINAFKRYEYYMNQKREEEEWENMSDLEKDLMSWRKPDKYK